MTSVVTPVGGNVFLDLGFSPEEAAVLKAESDARIAADLARRSGEPDCTATDLSGQPDSGLDVI